MGDMAISLAGVRGVRKQTFASLGVRKRRLAYTAPLAGEIRAPGFPFEHARRCGDAHRAAPCWPASGPIPYLSMKGLGKFLQIVGLAIPPLVVLAQLSEQITAGQMLIFLVAAVCCFAIGRLAEGYLGW
jgi:hypothetical protein